MSKLFQRPKDDASCSFVKFGSYSTKRGQFDTKFKTFRDISPKTMSREIEGLIIRLRERKNQRIVGTGTIE